MWSWALARRTTALHAPYLDYRPLRPNELDIDRLLSHPACAWITRDLEQQAVAHAIAQVVPQHLQEVRGRRWGGSTRPERR